MPGRARALSLEPAITRLMAHRRVLIGADFDGVLAPLAETPDLAVPDPRALALLVELAGRPGVEAAVVSGRAHADLSAMVGDMPGVILVGEHGNDMGQSFDKPDVLYEARELVDRLHDMLPGSVVEEKPRSVTFHTRRLDREQRLTASRVITDWATGRKGIELLKGKEVYELTVATRSKGDAIAELGADTDAVAYLGDDRTDETVFERLGPDDVGIKVGPGQTLAEYRVDDVDGVVEVLELMLARSRDGSDG